MGGVQVANEADQPQATKRSTPARGVACMLLFPLCMFLSGLQGPLRHALVFDARAVVVTSGPDCMQLTPPPPWKPAPPRPKGKLRLDWSELGVRSEPARRMRCLQQDCTKRRFVGQMSSSGMGSSIHAWAKSLKVAQDNGATLSTAWSGVPWVHDDLHSCTAEQIEAPLSCYFGTEVTSSATCGQAPPCSHPGDTACVVLQDLTPARDERTWLAHHTEADGFTMEGAVEFLFSHVQRVVIAEAERQLALIFGAEGVPHPLITVHVRWGDKATEMEPVGMQVYIDAVREMSIKHELGETPAVFLATKNAEACTQFKALAPPNWRVFAGMDGREKMQSSATEHGRVGQAGLTSLAALLLAMEADYYVLTMASNWSRLMDELRKAVIEPRICGNEDGGGEGGAGCTDMVDLAPIDHLYARD